MESQTTSSHQALCSQKCLGLLLFLVTRGPADAVRCPYVSLSQMLLKAEVGLRPVSDLTLSAAVLAILESFDQEIEQITFSQ